MSADFIDGNKALLLRRAILLQLEAASPASLPPDALSAGLEIYALPSDPKTLAAARLSAPEGACGAFPFPHIVRSRPRKAYCGGKGLFRVRGILIWGKIFPKSPIIHQN